MSITKTRFPAHHLLTGVVVGGSLIALPFAFICAPALATPATTTQTGTVSATTTALPRYQDCFHTGHMQWQQDRGRRMWGDCDNRSGHWQQGPDSEQGGGQWQWHRDHPQQPAPKFNNY